MSYEELEALHDVLEAARCYWFAMARDNPKAAKALQTTNRLQWRLGSELPLTGTPSERFAPVFHSSLGGTVERILAIVEDLNRQYSTQHDPWFADDVYVSQDILAELSGDEVKSLTDALGRLGLRVEPQIGVLSSISVGRTNHGQML